MKRKTRQQRVFREVVVLLRGRVGKGEGDDNAGRKRGREFP